MQGCAPEAIDIGSESEATKKLYGLDEPITEPFGRQCLLARRLVEHGVRFVQVFQGGMGNQNTDTWDAHSNVKANHRQHAAESDLPIAGLLTDLKARGLLDSTLVIWHGEFGRMPISQRGVGRDHNPGVMTVWMAGAGIKGGQSIGSSDEFGYKAGEQPISYHDLHATMLHLLGIDHTKLTYRYNGRDMRLTDVYGALIPQIVRLRTVRYQGCRLLTAACSSVVQAISGTPINFSASAAGLRAPNNSQTPNATGKPEVLGGIGPDTLWFDTWVFSAPAALAWGNVGRNALLTGPGYVNLDASIVKIIRFGQRRAESRGLLQRAEYPALRQPERDVRQRELRPCDGNPGSD